MDDLKVLECHVCGNYNAAHFIHLKKGYICKHCNAYHYYSTKDEETRCHIGYSHIRNYEFPQAETEFRSILKQYPDSVSARWGFLLAHFGVVEITGFFEKKMHDDGTSEFAVKPIYCFQHYEKWKHKTFRTEPEYERLTELLANEPKALSVCKQKAAEIDTALEEFKKSKKSSDRDIFICVKISNATENDPDAQGRTEDFEEAKLLYKELSDRGANVFFSFVTLKGDKIKADYQIWTNLLKSKKMLLIASKNEYLESAWVKSEWKRWRYLNREEQLYIYILDDEQPFEILPNELAELEKQIYHPQMREKLIEDILSKEEDDTLLAENNEQELINKIISQIQEQSTETKTKKQKKKKTEKPPKKTKTEKPPQNRKKKNNTVSLLIFVIICALSALLCSISALVLGDFSDNATTPDQTTPEQTTTEQTSPSETTTEQTTTESVFPSASESQGLVYTLNSDKQSYTLSGLGSCLDTNLVIPDTYQNLPVTAIKNDAFSYNQKIKSVIIPDTIKSIGSGAFYKCEKLESIKLGNHVENIYPKAFYGCISLKELTIPASVQTMISTTRAGGETIGVFENCSALEKLIIGDSTTETVMLINHSTFKNCYSLREVYIGKQVKTIGENAFLGCKNIEKLEIQSNITIKDSAFRGCEKLKDSNGLVIVNNILFDYYGYSEVVTIPDNVKSIGEYAFANSYRVKEIKLPYISDMGEYSFYMCNNLEKIYFSGTCAEWDAITKGTLGLDLTIICTDGTVYYKNPS